MARKRVTPAPGIGLAQGVWAPGPLLVAAADDAAAAAAEPFAREVARWLGREVAIVQTPAAGAAKTPGTTGPTLLVAGPPARAIIATAKAARAALVVLGAPPEGASFGTTTRAVLRGSPCPVLFVPARGASGGGPILLPQDGTAAMADLGPIAAWLADRAGTPLEVLHVACDGCREPEAIALPRHLDHPEYDWAAWRETFLMRACGCGCGGERPRLRVRVGRPSEEIRAAAEAVDARLIVLGWRGRLEGRATTLREVVAGATRPVLVIRKVSPLGGTASCPGSTTSPSLDSSRSSPTSATSSSK